MLDYTLLDALSIVARLGSFDAAAAELQITPSAVSQRITLLERKMGAVLLKRGRPCVATPAGARLSAHIEQVRALEAGLDGLLPDADSPFSRESWATMNLSVDEALIGSGLVDALAFFCKGRKVLLQLTREDETSDECIESGAVHGFLTTTREPRSGFVSERVGTFSFSVVASQRVFERHFRTGMGRKAFLGVACVTSRGNAMLSRHAVRRIARCDVDFPTHVMFSNEDVRQACLAGMGWGLCAMPSILDDLGAGRLIDLSPGKTFDVSLYWHASGRACELVAGLCDTLRSYALQALPANETSRRTLQGVS